MAALSGWKLQERSDGGFAVKENYDGKHPAGNRQFLHRALRRGRTGIHPARTEKTASSENDADGRRPRPLYAGAGRGGRLAGGDSAAQKHDGAAERRQRRYADAGGRQRAAAGHAAVRQADSARGKGRHDSGDLRQQN